MIKKKALPDLQAEPSSFYRILKKVSYKSTIPYPHSMLG